MHESLSLSANTNVCVCMSEKLHAGQNKAPGRVPRSICLGEAPLV